MWIKLEKTVLENTANGMKLDRLVCYGANIETRKTLEAGTIVYAATNDYFCLYDALVLGE